VSNGWLATRWGKPLKRFGWLRVREHTPMNGGVNEIRVVPWLACFWHGVGALAILQSPAFSPDVRRQAALRSLSPRLRGLHPAKAKLEVVQGCLEAVGLMALGVPANGVEAGYGLADGDAPGELQWKLTQLAAPFAAGELARDRSDYLGRDLSSRCLFLYAFPRLGKCLRFEAEKRADLKF
jgi:hypothetical protein